MMKMNLRSPAVAGSFYPADSEELNWVITRYMNEAATVPLPGKLKALIVPHAGYVYSGPIAATAFKLLGPLVSTIRKVVLIGPSHRVPIDGAALSSHCGFQTPLGSVDIDETAYEKLRELPGVEISDKVHAHEHCLEVQVPFLQKALKDFTLVPIVIGDCKPQEVSTLLETVWDGDETLIVVSSDLSHYLEFEEAREMDANTNQQILSNEWQKLEYDQACGRIPIQGLLISAQKHSLKPTLLDLRNSGDTSGHRDQVVGYASYAFTE